ncbi:hypothetical protein Tco_1079412 [Tanacetum coccineum]|uniref:Uncharacterized protein n=1 Tax=Tanacetum coccineum TaxID=301880 RepID=A0ABQ5HTG5_9ASTR
MKTWCELIIQQKVKEEQEEKIIAEKAANHRTHTLEFLGRFKLTYKESTIPLNNTPHSPDFSALPPQPQYETYSCELCGNNAHYGYDFFHNISVVPVVGVLMRLFNYPVSSQPPEESIKEFFVKHAQEMITPVQSAVAIQQHKQAVQKEQEEQAAFTPYWKCSVFDEDDDEYTFQYKEYL